MAENLDFPESINVVYDNVETALKAKVKAVKEAKAKAKANDETIDDKTMLSLTSFNVLLNGLMFNGRQVSALLTIDETSTLNDINKIVFVKVQKNDKNGKPIIFYARQQSIGTCKFKVIAQ